MDDPQSLLGVPSDDDEDVELSHYTLTTPLLVALTAASGHHKPRYHDSHNFPGAQPGNGTSSRLRRSDSLRRVLDALASLCISRPQKQALAIGAQIDKPNLTLTIAENQPVTPDTIEYLKAVWGILQSLSDLYASRRTDMGETHRSPNMLRSQIAAEHTANLAKLVYTFTSSKNMKRWAKRWEGDGLLGFARKFRAQKGSGLDGKDGQFKMMAAKLSIALRCLRGEIVDWAKVVGYMTDATDLADDLLADPCWFETLAVEITAKAGQGAQPTEDPYPLRRHIDKLTSHHRYFRALIAFARSPRHRLAFTLKLSVEPVLLPTITPAGFIDVPTAAASWAQLLEDLCAQHHFHIELARVQQILAYLASHHLASTVPHHVHPECALIAHYDRRRTSSRRSYKPACAYISVSKPPCEPCQLWLAAYNARLNVPTFYTRSGNGRWDFPWSSPIVAGWNDPLEDAMGKVCIEYLGSCGALRSMVTVGETKWEDDEVERKAREERNRVADLTDF